MSDRETQRWLVAERRAELARRLAREGRLRVSEVAVTFGVSDETVRRDLVYVARELGLRKVYGGAILPETVAETPFVRRGGQKLKDALAHKALSLVPDSGTVWLDGGTAITALAATLHTSRDVVLVTHSVSVAQALCLNRGVQGHVVVVGGDLDTGSQVLLGPSVIRLILDTVIDAAFLGATRLSVNDGCFTKAHREADIKRLIIERAQCSYLVAQSAKLTGPRGVCFAGWSAFEAWVTDTALPDDARDRISAQGPTVLLAEGGIR